MIIILLLNTLKLKKSMRIICHRASPSTENTGMRIVLNAVNAKKSIGDSRIVYTRWRTSVYCNRSVTIDTFGARCAGCERTIIRGTNV